MIHGILNIDKPTGITSHRVVSRVRRLANMKRVGHAGTLDPLATGVLVLGVGRATRLLEYVVGQPKRYQTTVRLGQTTDTYDADGTILSETKVVLEDGAIEAALQQFIGRIQQVPPMFSAIKRDGQPLYKLARKGIEIERAARDVTISDLMIIGRNGNDVTLDVACSTGTYIRSLAHDLGQVLGCGGHVTMLRRTEVGTFVEPDSVRLDDLSAENITTHLQPLDKAITHLPQTTVNADTAVALTHGKWVRREAHHPQADLVRIYDETGHFVGLVKPNEDAWQPHKILYDLVER